MTPRTFNSNCTGIVSNKKLIDDSRLIFLCFQKCAFLLVFAQFIRFCRSCPFCRLPWTPLGTSNSQKVWKLLYIFKRLVIKIFQFDDWLSYAFKNFCNFLRFWAFCGFSRSCPFCSLPLAPLGTTNSQVSLEIIIYIQTASHNNFSMW